MNKITTQKAEMLKIGFYKKGLTLLLFLLGLGIYAQNGQTLAATGAPAKFPDAGQFAGSEITYKLIGAPNLGYGYDIYSNGKLMIHQPSVPGMPGNSGFKTREGAEKVAQLVVKKIKKGEMPPTVTIDEMKKLKAID